MSESWQVYKFGGSSLGISGRLPKVLELVAAAPRPLALVISALGDSTDWLILAARSAAEGNISQARRELAQVRELATATARSVLNSQGQKGVKHDLDEILTPVERLLSGIELTRECSPRTLDSIISVGERISVAVLTRALVERGVPAIPVDARDFVVTDATHGSATVDKAGTAAKFATGQAKSYHQVAANNSRLDRPAINYVRGRLITVLFDSAAVQTVQVDEHAVGMYLEPIPQDTVKAVPAKDGAPAKGAAAGKDSASVTPPTKPAPRSGAKPHARD